MWVLILRNSARASLHSATGLNVTHPMVALFARWHLIPAVVWVLSNVVLAEICSAQAPMSAERAILESDDRLTPLIIRGQDLASEEFVPTHIRDNAFLVEEAFNQEPGVVQHIFNWVALFDWPQESTTRNFAALYTMELPLGTQKHQFSFTTQFLTAFEKPDGGPAVQQGDVGDTFLNYRYQLLADDELLWCAPRFSLIVPTADERFGMGTGEVGYQFNLPISRYGEQFDVHFNAGVTHTPDASVPLFDGSASPTHDLRGYNLGASTFWKPQTYLHFFVEGLCLWGEEIDDLGRSDGVNQVFVNPGVRYAICQFEDVEWVIGAAVPVGLTEESPDVGAFFYMSIEHVFRRTE